MTPVGLPAPAAPAVRYGRGCDAVTLSSCMTARPIRLACSAVLFDLDGVLVDSTACIEATWRQWAEGHGLDAAAILHIAHGRRAVEIIQIAAPHLDVATEASTLISAEIRTSIDARPAIGAHELLVALPADRWAVVTSGVRVAAEHRLRHSGLPVPSVMVCADEVTSGKPDPEGYLAGAKRLGVAPHDCVVIEDAPPGIAAAHAAGMRAIALATTHPPDALRDADVVATGLDAITVRTPQGDRATHLSLEVRVALCR
jgi:mannitol-1-/sugar-/sorbitol-6-phosphatase